MNRGVNIRPRKYVGVSRKPVAVMMANVSKMEVPDLVITRTNAWGPKQQHTSCSRAVVSLCCLQSCKAGHVFSEQDFYPQPKVNMNFNGTRRGALGCVLQSPFPFSAISYIKYLVFNLRAISLRLITMFQIIIQLFVAMRQYTEQEKEEGKFPANDDGLREGQNGDKVLLG